MAKKQTKSVKARDVKPGMDLLSPSTGKWTPVKEVERVDERRTVITGDVGKCYYPSDRDMYVRV